ncbi:AAA family ATPase [Paenibacillus larvae]|uniref:Helicase/secretion neighborhood CpaE-like protein n=1 Tax=Paenibacillus larvae subsp. larvae TaxID=147375 RepID=A0A2L1U7M1_9BACL|nr:AAA family ATPase [Paenibacillus larvae]AVF28920.1 helicase/secretion neighborhood CpaE-like protein [Paenibacillus larvae subsp. larvae]MCY9502646.1 AAA family ATPase [Paenibacillus larvae]MCY9749534.1 AAA family ATPase [Paenibacillus larvae]MDR5608877.1 AAA family ATPase [Paenibacillus larvae]
MRFFLCIPREVTYKKIVDRLGSEHQLSKNLQSVEEFRDQLAATQPDCIIIDPNIDYYESVLALKDSITIIDFNGSFPVLIDEISDMIAGNNQSSRDKQPQSPPINQESLEPSQPEITQQPFFQKVRKSAGKKKIREKKTKDEELIQKEIGQNQKPSEPDESENETQKFDLEQLAQEAQALTEIESEVETQNQEITNTVDQEKKEIAESTTSRELIFNKSVEESADIRERYLGNVIGIWGAAGGIGKTEIAKNLAIHLANNMKIALLDFNLVNPDIGDQLGIGFPKGQTLYDAYQAYIAGSLSIASLDRMFVDYHGVKVLVGIPDALTQSDLSELFFITLLKSIRSHFDVIVLDLDNDLTAAAGIQILSYCNRIIVPLTTSSSVLLHTKAYMNLMRQGQMPIDIFEFVINRDGEGGSVDEAFVMRELKKKPIGTLPYNKSHIRSVENARPVYLTGLKSMVKLCQKIGEPYNLALQNLNKLVTEVPKQEKRSFNIKLPKIKGLTFKWFGGKTHDS